MSRGVLEASRELWAVEGRLGRVAEEEVAALEGRSSWSNSIPFSPEKKYFFKSVVKHSSTCIGAGALTCVRRSAGTFTLGCFTIGRFTPILFSLWIFYSLGCLLHGCNTQRDFSL